MQHSLFLLTFLMRLFGRIQKMVNSVQVLLLWVVFRTCQMHHGLILSGLKVTLASTLFCTWMSFHSVLKTRRLLVARGIIQDESSVLCNRGKADCLHLFVTCPFGAFILRRIKAKFGVSIKSSIRNLVNECHQSKDGNIILAKLSFPAFAWKTRRE